MRFHDNPDDNFRQLQRSFKAEPTLGKLSQLVVLSARNDYELREVFGKWYRQEMFDQLSDICGDLQCRYRNHMISTMLSGKDLSIKVRPDEFSKLSLGAQSVANLLIEYETPRMTWFVRETNDGGEIILNKNQPWLYDPKALLDYLIDFLNDKRQIRRNPDANHRQLQKDFEAQPTLAKLYQLNTLAAREGAEGQFTSWYINEIHNQIPSALDEVDFRSVPAENWKENSYTYTTMGGYRDQVVSSTLVPESGLFLRIRPLEHGPNASRDTAIELRITLYPQLNAPTLNLRYYRSSIFSSSSYFVPVVAQDMWLYDAQALLDYMVDALIEHQRSTGPQINPR